MDIPVGVREIHRALEAGQVERGLVTKTVAWYRHLIKMARVLDYGLVARTASLPVGEAAPLAARQAELQGTGRPSVAAAVRETAPGRALLSIVSMIGMLFGLETEYSEESLTLTDRASNLARTFETVMAVAA